MNWDQEDLPAKKGEPLPIAPAPSRRRQFGLRHLMMLSVYFAILFAEGARAFNTGREIDLILGVIALGLGFVGFGLFLTMRLARFTAVGWIIAFVGLTGMSVVMVGYFTIFTIPVMIGVVIHLVGRRRATQQEAMLWVLALASERGRPLGPAMAALAAQSTGVYRLRALRVAECLDHGMPLPESLDFVPPAVPATARVLIRVGHDSGALAESLRDAAVARSTRPPGMQSFGARLGYICLVIAVLQSIVSFIIYFILPRFEAIFKDFGINLPPVTVWIVMATHWVTSSYVFPVVTALELCLLLYLPYAFSGYGNLSVPLLDRFFLRRHSVLVLRCLAMVVAGDRPITMGLQILSRWYPTSWVRARLAGAYLATSEGLDWIEALVAYRLISRADAALLESARRAGNLPWALGELAEGSARRLNYRLQFVTQVLLTLLLLGVGGMVGFVAVAYFLPLTTLIASLSG